MKKLPLLIFAAFSVLQASSSIGSATGQFLEVNLNVRNMAMGNAATSVVNGAAATLVNPAGLVNFSSPDAGYDAFGSYLNWPADISFGSLAMATRLSEASAIALSASYVNYGEEIRTTPEMPFGDGTFTMGAYAIGITYSRYLTDKFSVGLTAKNVAENYDGSGYSQFAYDFGTLYNTGYRDLKIAMSILHFSSETTFSGRFLNYSDAVKIATGDSSSYESWPLPMTFRTGLSMNFLDSGPLQLLAAFDMIHSNNSDELYGLGFEAVYLQDFALRAGYQFGTDLMGLTLGGGLRLINALTVDYAFAAMDYFGSRHRFSLNVSF